jgi:hypothetical protein
MGIEYVNYAQYMSVPEENIQLVRDFIADINAEAGAQPGVVPPQPQPMGAGGPGPAAGGPQASPMAPPQSNLIPNVSGIQGVA